MQKSPDVQTFADLLERITGFGDRTALVDASTNRNISFASLHTRAFELAEKLPADIPSGSRVILYGLNPLDWVPLFFAVILRGWTVVPLDTRISAEFFRSVEELTTPALIIIGDDTNIDSAYSTMRFSDLVNHIGRHDDLPTLDPDAPAEILFTSGTWSRPKGVTLSQRNILTNAQQVLSIYKHKREDTSLAVLPLSHAYQQTNGLILPLLTGSEIVFLTSISSEALTSALRKYQVRTMLVVPRVLSLIESSLLRKIKSRRIRE
jgi:long-chain acyl-CoA synthetase